jgi:hypothetical protein
MTPWFPDVVPLRCWIGRVPPGGRYVAGTVVCMIEDRDGLSDYTKLTVKCWREAGLVVEYVLSQWARQFMFTPAAFEHDWVPGKGAPQWTAPMPWQMPPLLSDQEIAGLKASA